MAWFLAFFRFFLPRTLFEPNTSFKIGYPTDIRANFSGGAEAFDEDQVWQAAN